MELTNLNPLKAATFLLPAHGHPPSLEGGPLRPVACEQRFRTLTFMGLWKPNILGGHLALLVRGKKRNIGSVAAASNAHNAFDWSQAGWIDEPPPVLEVDFEDGMKVRRLQLQSVSAHRPSGNA